MYIDTILFCRFFLFFDTRAYGFQRKYFHCPTQVLTMPNASTCIGYRKYLHFFVNFSYFDYSMK